MTSLDDSLTNLGWLLNMNIMGLTSGNTTIKPLPNTTPSVAVETDINPNVILNMGRIKGIDASPVIETTMVSPPPTILTATATNEVDYRMNPHVKPPYSYAKLICMAMKESNKTKITLAGIYSWIIDNFMYYRVADSSWQNSIRHNLSLNKCFQRVARRRDEPGKGGFWRINPEYEETLMSGVFKRQRSNPHEAISSTPKRIKLESEGRLLSASPPVDYIDNDLVSDESTVAVKREPGEKMLLNLTGEEEDIDVTSDHTWSTILNQDIQVGGISVKMENILEDSNEAEPLCSESNSDSGFDDLLGSDYTAGYSTDTNSNEALDLTITGHGMQPSEWWHNEVKVQVEEDGQGWLESLTSSQNQTSKAFHPWDEGQSELDKAVASLDTDIEGLFDFGGLIS